jgi:hypothetical protein
MRWRAILATAALIPVAGSPACVGPGLHRAVAAVSSGRLVSARFHAKA